MPVQEMWTAVLRRMAFGGIWLTSAVMLYAPAAAHAEKSGYESVSVPGGPGDPSDPTLPFTGFDVATAGAVGVAMLLIGIGLWHLGGRSGDLEADDAS